MTKYLVLALAVLWTARAEACSIFAVSDGQNVLAGNNEDDVPDGEYLHPKVTFVPAGGEHRYGSMHYSFDDNYAQGGLNTAGLFYDINRLPQMSPAKYPAGTPEYPGSPDAILLHMLDTTASVKEALVLLHSYQLTGIDVGQIFVADRSGDAAVVGIGRDGTVTETRKTGNFLISTNFNLNNPVANYPECRFKIAHKLWDQDSHVTPGNVRKILSAIHFEGSSATLYSQVYDLKRAEATFYQFHDYASGVKINLAQELKKRGASTVLISTLFPYQPYSIDLSNQLIDVLKKAGVHADPDAVPKCSIQ